MAFPITEERKRTYTRDDLRALVALPENAEKSFELVNREIYEVAPPSYLHNYIVSLMLEILIPFIKSAGLGRVFGDNTGYDLPNGDNVIPDISYISNDRLPNPHGRLFIAPDLAIEVHSSSNKPRQMSDKIASYLEAGTHRVWVIYPDEQVIDVHRLLEDGSIAYKTHGIGDMLSGEHIIPGFVIPVADIFPEVPTPDS